MTTSEAALDRAVANALAPEGDGAVPTAIKGITQGPAWQDPETEKGRVFPCDSCSADLEFHIGEQKLRCPYCGSTQDLAFGDEVVRERDYQEALTRLKRQRSEGITDEAQTQEVDCDSCGAKVTFIGSLTSSECPYCSVPLQVEGAHRAENRLPADGVLPFQVDRRKARQSLRRWVASRWLAPGEFKKQGAHGSFHGVYLPFWTYDAMTFTRYRGQRGEHYYVNKGHGQKQRRERRTRWYPASGSFQQFFDDVLESATRALPAKVLRRLEPWPLELCKPFAEELLAGHTARTYEVGLEDGYRSAEQRMEVALRAEVRHRIGGDTQRIASLDTRHNAVKYKHLLLPVWLLSYRHGKKVYQVVVNATTAEVFGERPYSAWKIFFLVVAILIALLVVVAVL